MVSEVNFIIREAKKTLNARVEWLGQLKVAWRSLGGGSALVATRCAQFSAHSHASMIGQAAVGPGLRERKYTRAKKKGDPAGEVEESSPAESSKSSGHNLKLGL